MEKEIVDAINQLSSQVFEIENRLEFLYKKLNMVYVEETQDIDPQLLEALKKGNMIEAITVYRRLNNCDLATARTAVGGLLKKYH